MIDPATGLCTHVIATGDRAGEVCGRRHPAIWKHDGECQIHGCEEPALVYRNKSGRGKARAGLFCLEHSVEATSGELATVLDLQPAALIERLSEHRFLVHSRPKKNYDPTHVYEVDVGLDGACVCNCPGYYGRQSCWHINAVRKELTMTTETPGTAIVPVVLHPPRDLVVSDRVLEGISRTAEIALALAGTPALPKELNTKEKVMAVMLYGWELGLRPMSAIRHIFMIEGRPQPSAEVMLATAQQNDLGIRLILEEIDEEHCTMRLVRPSRQIDETYTVSVTDSDVARLIARDTPHQARGRDGAYETREGGWVLYRRDRLRNHTGKRLLRLYAADAMNNMVPGMREDAVDAEYEDITDEEPLEEYNEGDRPGVTYAQAADGRLVDTSTGEIVEPPAPPEVAAATAATATNGDKPIERIRRSTAARQKPTPPPPSDQPAADRSDLDQSAAAESTTPTDDVDQVEDNADWMPPAEPPSPPIDYLAVSRRIFKDLQTSLDAMGLMKVVVNIRRVFPETSPEGAAIYLDRAKDPALLATWLEEVQRGDGAIPEAAAAS